MYLKSVINILEYKKLESKIIDRDYTILRCEDFTIDTNDIPKIIFQTYYKKEKIPQKVYDNISKYCKGYEHCIYDDKDCIEFLTKYFKKNVVDKFNELEGAHKADLFRYCVLYIYGGIYLNR